MGAHWGEEHHTGGEEMTFPSLRFTEPSRKLHGIGVSVVWQVGAQMLPDMPLVKFEYGQEPTQ